MWNHSSRAVAPPVPISNFTTDKDFLSGSQFLAHSFQVCSNNRALCLIALTTPVRRPKGLPWLAGDALLTGWLRRISQQCRISLSLFFSLFPCCLAHSIFDGTPQSRPRANVWTYVHKRRSSLYREHMCYAVPRQGFTLKDNMRSYERTSEVDGEKSKLVCYMFGRMSCSFCEAD